MGFFNAEHKATKMQRTASALYKSAIAEGLSPEEAIAQVQGELFSLGLSVTDVEFTPTEDGLDLTVRGG